MMTPEKMQKCVDEALALLKETNVESLIWQKIAYIQDSLMNEQNFEKILDLCDMFQQNKIIFEEDSLLMVEVRLFINLLKTISCYKLGKLSQFIETYESFEKSHLEINKEGNSKQKKMHQMNQKFITVVSQYYHLVQKMTEMEINVANLSKEEIFYLSSLMANFDKQKAFYLLLEILKSDKKWNKDKAFKAALNILESIPSSPERKSLTHQLNSILKY